MNMHYQLMVGKRTQGPTWQRQLGGLNFYLSLSLLTSVFPFHSLCSLLIVSLPSSAGLLWKCTRDENELTRCDVLPYDASP